MAIKFTSQINSFIYMQSFRDHYRFLSQIYDDIMDVGYGRVYEHLLRKFLKVKIIKGKRILDLGCGTGTLLKLFSRKNETTGIDLSPKMIRIAKNKDKKSVYCVGNITNFKFNRQFDVILCTFDTINHLRNFSDWRKLFTNTSKHLTRGGLFIFDFNTLDKFRLIDKKIIRKSFKNFTVIFETKFKKPFCLWDITILVKKGGEADKIYKEKIIEVSFSEKRVVNLLKEYFKKVIVAKRKRGRIFIVCKK